MTTLNLSTATNMFIGGREASSLYLPRLGKIWEHPYSHVVHTASGRWYVNLPIPQWCNTVYFEMIGGGGGGQTGNGASNSSGRPGGASAWVQNSYDLNRVDGETYRYDYYVGGGGAGGVNSDHASGQNGEKSEVRLKRVLDSGAAYNIAAFSSDVVGLGGPESGLGVGATSGAVIGKYSVRNYIYLPSAGGVGRGAVGKSPGGGGGCGEGGFLGKRGVGRAGGNGRIYAIFLGDRA